MSSRALILCLGLVWVAAVAGCLREPEIEERWTNLEIIATTVDAEETIDTAAGEPISVSAQLTFRSILTGAFVAELRASDTITSNMVELDPETAMIGTAEDVDFILENSVTAGRDFRTVTGFPDLVRTLDFQFGTFIPLAEHMAGPATGYFLVLYMGSEEEVENDAGEDSVVITPFISSDYEILHKGIAIPLNIPPPPPSP